MKKISILFIIIALMIGVSGCMDSNVIQENRKWDNPKNIHEKMVAYMNEKYNDIFTFDSVFGGSVGEKSTQITVKSKKFPNEKIWVEFLIEDGIEKYYDNYIDYKFEAQTKEYLTELMQSMFGSNVTVEYGVDSGGTRNSYDDSTSFEEYIKGDSNPIVFNAHIDMDISDQEHKEITDIITKEFVEKRNMKVVGKLYFTKNDASLFFITNNEGIETQRWS